MTTPTEFGPNAGPEGSEQREVWMKVLAQAMQLQADNAAFMQRLATQGIAGVDTAAQVTRLTCLIDTLFGTLDGHSGVVNMGNARFRLELELLMQRRVAETLDQVDAMVGQQRAASGGAHQTRSGLYLAGRNDKINGGH